MIQQCIHYKPIVDEIGDPTFEILLSQTQTKPGCQLRVVGFAIDRVFIYDLLIIYFFMQTSQHPTLLSLIKSLLSKSNFRF